MFFSQNLFLPLNRQKQRDVTSRWNYFVVKNYLEAVGIMTALKGGGVNGKETLALAGLFYYYGWCSVYKS